jgi:hypothetical protein
VFSDLLGRLARQSFVVAVSSFIRLYVPVHSSFEFSTSFISMDNGGLRVGKKDLNICCKGEEMPSNSTRRDHIVRVY